MQPASGLDADPGRDGQGVRHPLAIHNHGPEDKRFPSPYDVWKAVEKYDRRVGLCIDVGHTARANVDPAESIRRCRERLYDLHFKDIDSTAPDGTTVEAGGACST